MKEPLSLSRDDLIFYYCKNDPMLFRRAVVCFSWQAVSPGLISGNVLTPYQLATVLGDEILGISAGRDFRALKGGFTLGTPLCETTRKR